jgi:uncharacterized protein YdgA (DUF945 family)
VQKSGILAIVLMILIGGAAAAPYWFGMQAEEAYNKTMQEITKDGQVVITRQTYERGWLDSTAEATFTLGGLPVSLTVLNKIHHGPIPVAPMMEGELDFNPVLALIKSQASLALPMAIKVPPISGKTTIQLDGQILSHVDVAAISATDPSGGSLIWQGLSGDVTLSADLKQTSLNLLAPLLQLSSPAQKLSVSKARITANLKQGASGLTTGSLSYAIDKVSSETDTGNLVLNGLVLATTSAEASGNLSANVDLKLQSITDGATTYGPGVISIKVNNLDTATLAKYKKELNELQAKKLPPEQMPSVLMGKMVALVAGLAKKTPEIDVSKISFKFKEGEITGSGKLVLDGSNAEIAENPELLLMALRGDGEVLVPQAALRALTALDLSRKVESLKSKGKFSEDELKKLTPQKISEISASTAPKYMQGYASKMKLVPEGDNYKMSLSLSRGQFLLNGEPL